MRTPNWVLSFVLGSAMVNAIRGTLNPLRNVTELLTGKKETKNRTKTILEESNEACLKGEITSCFKSSAMMNLDWYLSGKSYAVNEHARIVRMSRSLRSLGDWGSRSERNPGWSGFVESLLTRVEAFVESMMLEVDLTDDLTQDGRYAPRFIDDIASEIDALEDKNDNIFSRTKMKKLLIPLLLVLKVFKLKLLLFLPLILGLASFKKLIGFLVIALPAIIGFLRICKPDLSHSYGSFGHSSYYNLPPHRRYQLATGVYTRAGVRGHPVRSGDPARERETYQNVGNSYQNYPFNHNRYAHPSEDGNDRHHLAYNSYHENVNK